MRVTNQKHDVIAVSVFDRREMELPNVGAILLEDAETGEVVEVNTTDKSLRERYATEARVASARRRQWLQRSGLDIIEVETDVSYQRELKKFFEGRIKRAGR